ncbi:hypothetical protein PIB30_058269, partial [Stylosanthes scabra]|nr:hypothetical protein [Stylosanthes scabra]
MAMRTTASQQQRENGGKTETDLLLLLNNVDGKIWVCGLYSPPLMVLYGRVGGGGGELRRCCQG